MFDSTVRVTDLVMVGVFLFGGLTFLWTMRSELRMMARDVRLHSIKLDKLEAVITALAVQTQRMNDLDRRIEELRHGRGYITADVDGMYTRTGKVQNIP
jgi:cupin superfamily acireductone dioxygenase involved in methionine salvage